MAFSDSTRKGIAGKFSVRLRTSDEREGESQRSGSLDPQVGQYCAIRYKGSPEAEGGVGVVAMAKHYALWPSRYSDCTDPEKLNMMPFVNEDVSNFGE